MPSIYPPRRPRASPLWQLVHHGWDDFIANYESKYRKDLGPLHPAAVTTVESFLRCGDLAAGFTRLQCSDCGHERLLAFTCKGRHFCPSCHQRRVRSTSDWIATAVCHEVPHRQFVFTIPDHIIRPPAPSPNQQPENRHHQSQILLIPAPPKQSARDMRPLWRDLILQVWGGDPQECPCCKGTLKPVRQVIRREQIEYSLLTSVSISSNPKADWYGVRDSVLNFSYVFTACGRELSHSHARHRRPSTSKNAEGL